MCMLRLLRPYLLGKGNLSDKTMCRPLFGPSYIHRNNQGCIYLLAKTGQFSQYWIQMEGKSKSGLPVIAPDTWTIVCVPSRYTVSMLCSEGRGSAVVASTLGLRIVSMYGWTSREKLRVCFFSIPLRSVIGKWEVGYRQNITEKRHPSKVRYAFTGLIVWAVYLMMNTAKTTKVS